MTEEQEQRPLSLKERIAALQQATSSSQPRPPSSSISTPVKATASKASDDVASTSSTVTSLSVPSSGNGQRSRSASTASNRNPAAASCMALYGGSGSSASPTKSRPATPTIASSPAADADPNVIDSIRDAGRNELSSAFPPISPNITRSTSPAHSRTVIAVPLGVSDGSISERAGASNTNAALTTEADKYAGQRTHLAATAASRDRSASISAATSELRKLDLRAASPRRRSPGSSPARPTFSSRPIPSADTDATATSASPGPSLPPRRTTLASPVATPASTAVADPPISPRTSAAPRLPPRRSATQSSTTSTSSTLSNTASMRSNLGPALPPRPPAMTPSHALSSPSLISLNSTASIPTGPSSKSIPLGSQFRRRPIDPRARQRYEALFDRLMRLIAARPAWIKPGEKDVVPSEVVRIVWLRSRLDSDTLERIWDATAEPSAQGLNRDGFCQGMWAIDEELRSRQSS